MAFIAENIISISEHEQTNEEGGGGGERESIFGAHNHSWIIELFEQLVM